MESPGPKVPRPERRPTIAITMGDPAGVGPELALQAAADATIQQQCRPLIVGDGEVLRRVARQLDLAMPPVVDSLDQLAAGKGPACVSLGALESLQPGQVSAATGQASYDYVVWAIDATLQGHTAAVVTGPIHKEAWHAARIPFPGHTELLAEKTGTTQFRMMLTSPEVSCVLATVHIGYREVADRLSTADVLESIRLGHQAISRIRGCDPRVTVCGLNPHAGEHGLFGNREEERLIVPAIQQAQAEGFQVVGPLPPDTAFTPARRATTDVYVCMYHDQGLIPLKALAFDDAVNITLGLPIIRTSVDHGTALDIAWQGKANPSSMRAAIELACRL
jgi:4-hydroxythreonine-4-phosphate dehydrogenase